MDDFIPVCQPRLSGNERRYLNECIDSGWISWQGSFVARFEEAMAMRVGRAHAVAVSGGTAALEVAVAALDLAPGDEVIMPAFTIISCAAAVVRRGAQPVLIDCDPATWNIRADEIEARITDRTRAIMVVHIYGLPVDMDPVMDVAARNGLAVIEDAAEAIGQSCREKPCGSFGAISTFSFYPNKHVTTGEGGMVLTDDDGLADRSRALRNMCFQDGDRFVHEELGWNYRFSNLHAAVGLAQLERLDETLATKRQIGARYNERLADVDGLQLPVAHTDFAQNVYWVYGVVLDEDRGLEAAEVMGRLRERAIGTRAFFYPMHQQPVLRRMGHFVDDTHPVAEKIARYGFYLPSGPVLTDDQLDRVADAVKDVLR